MLSFRTVLMVVVTLLDVAFFARALHCAELPGYVQDFRKGAAGDTTALDQGLKATEAALAANPKDAEAEVWHGVGLAIRSKGLFDNGEYQNGSKVFDQSLHDMDAAAALAPGEPRILIPRGATLLQATLFMPAGDATTDLLHSALNNYLQVVDRVHGLTLDRVLYGIADAYSRLGQPDQATKYFERVAAEAKGTGYAQNARVWLTTKTLTRDQELCNTCETSQ